MKITRIKVEGLYGLHHYDIPLREDENIKIIHAPNGYGKTTLLKLISDILQCRLFEISIIPFECFSISFNTQMSIQVVKEESFIKYVVIKEEGRKEYEIPVGAGSIPLEAYDLPIDDIEKRLPFLKRIAKAAWYDTKKNEKVSQKDIIDRYEEQFFVDKELGSILSEIRQAMPVHFIHANRLIDSQYFSEPGTSLRRKNTMPSVLMYAKELADRIDTALAQSAELAEELNRTFPARLIAEMKNKESQEQSDLATIERQLQELEKRRLQLEEIGLLETGPLQEIGYLTDADNHTLKVLKLYIQDSQLVLDVFNDIETKMNLMREIINKRFNYKVMQFIKKKGFMFELPNHNMLSPDKLSSGEQNELIVIFELLFKSYANSLILIDEPEISLHIAWQQQFLEDMQAISGLTDVKIIIATHSPDIINGRWDLTTGLEEC